MAILCSTSQHQTCTARNHPLTKRETSIIPREIGNRFGALAQRTEGDRHRNLREYHTYSTTHRVSPQLNRITIRKGCMCIYLNYMSVGYLIAIHLWRDKKKRWTIRLHSLYRILSSCEERGSVHRANPDFSNSNVKNLDV